jgi:hypothetical protein
MITIKEIIKELKRFRGDAFCYAYEGEICGVVVVDKSDNELGYITTSENDNFKSETVIY